MIGRTLGRYRIDAELGRGGMGVVYRATQTTLGREVAIKMLSPHLAESGEHLARFRREAEVLARLQHENIVHIYDVEEVEGSFCIVMEFVSGPSLGEVLHREGTLGEARVREIAMALAAGLEAAHRKGIVHRDLKPDNILFTPDGRPRITDFGIARIAGGDAMARTRTGILMGTPYYMSPEQARGDEVTGTSDLYALGVLIHQMLSGSVPFEGTDPISVAIKHMQETPPALHEVAPGVHPALVAVVERAMQKDPGHRFASAAEMARALRRVPVNEATDTLPWEPGAAAAWPTGAEGSGSGPDTCGVCGAPVLPAFLTCPRCGGALVGTHPGGRDTTGSRSGSGTGPASGAEAATGARPSAGGASAAATGASAAAGTAQPGGSHGFPARVAALIDTYAPAVRQAVEATAAEAMTGAAAALRRWSEPGGRWNVPPLLWAGIALVIVGLTVGLGRGLLPGGAPGGSANLPGTVGPTSVAHGGATDGANAHLGGGSGGTGGTVAGIFEPSPFSDGTGARGTGAVEPGRGASEPGSGDADAGGIGAGGGGATTDPPGVGGTAIPGRDASGAGDGASATVGGSDASRGSDPPPAFDADGARAELASVVERQRRATESGDAELFGRDLSAPLARVNTPFLAQLHQAWTEIQSEIWNLSIALEGPERARVDFHTRITGIPRGTRTRQVIEDTHVYWLLEAGGTGWTIVDARSAPHAEMSR